MGNFYTCWFELLFAIISYKYNFDNGNLISTVYFSL